MCDYSLHDVASRDAQVGDRLVTCEFRCTTTRGFAAVGVPNVAVCLQPGTELVFERPIRREHRLRRFHHSFGLCAFTSAIFRQVGLESPHQHHDALELPDGTIIMLTRLLAGQTATVLQMPVKAARPDAVSRAATACNGLIERSVIDFTAHGRPS
ncbi:MAG: hypothetical protein EPO08_05040 [Rhodospirillaceae bacterium]|nr:MAG: hypothetical protein EPO08_05040 [Rhodospirillaceae bacterium]